jgi:Holliday junction resolvasome RuvABC DNA-binding subunit
MSIKGIGKKTAEIIIKKLKKLIEEGNQDGS